MVPNHKKEGKRICQECRVIRKRKAKENSKKLRENAKIQRSFSKAVLDSLENTYHNSQKLSSLEKRTTNNENLSRINFNLHYRPTETITKIQVQKHEDFKNKIEQETIKEKAEETIYQAFWIKDNNGNIIKYNYRSIIGWTSFLILTPIITDYWYNLRKKKSKIDNSLDEIKDNFRNWWLGILGSLFFYVTFFFLVEQAITKWVKPNANWLSKNYSSITSITITIILGLMFVLDGIVSSNLKTNLQRLSFSIEKGISDREFKKKIFFKTQDGTETLKENFKRFGIMVIATMIIGIFTYYKESFFYYFCYLIPVAYAVIRIMEVGRIIKKIK